MLSEFKAVNLAHYKAYVELRGGGGLDKNLSKLEIQAMIMISKDPS